MSDRIDELNEKLDYIARELSMAVDALDKAEEAWDDAYDQAFVDLKREMDEDGRKGDPPAHAVTTAARREAREVYRAWRRAKRAVQKWEQLAQLRKSELTGHQTIRKDSGGSTRGMTAHQRDIARRGAGRG